MSTIQEREVVRNLFKTITSDERLITALINYLEPDVNMLKANNLLKNFDVSNFNKTVLPIIKIIIQQYGPTEQGLSLLDRRLAASSQYMSTRKIAAQYVKPISSKLALKEELEKEKKISHQKENIVALQSLVNELAKDYAYLVKLDVPFCDDIVNHRPLVALLMMMNDTLRPLMERGQDELDAYIDNFDIYKQLLPYIKIQDGTTHGQWRHLVDPKKKCLVLTAKNCQVAASEQLKRTYGESDSKFLVLQGLSMKANDDNAEVHYLEV